MLKAGYKHILNQSENVQCCSFWRALAVSTMLAKQGWTVQYVVYLYDRGRWNLLCFSSQVHYNTADCFMTNVINLLGKSMLFIGLIFSPM